MLRMIRIIAFLTTCLIAVGAVHAKDATVEKWADGLAAPKGIALDENGSVYVVESGAGNLLWFDKDASQKKVLASGLRKAAFAYRYKDKVLVSEPATNCIVTISDNGKFNRIATSIKNPMGIWLSTKYGERFAIVSNRFSAVYAIEPELPAYQAVIFASRPGGMDVGFTDISINSAHEFYITDAGGSCLWLGDGRRAMRKVADQLNQPSGVTFGPDNHVYLTEEASGTLALLNPGGTVTRVAEGLGAPFDAVHTGGGIFLVTDSKNGCIWKVTLPH